MDVRVIILSIMFLIVFSVLVWGILLLIESLFNKALHRNNKPSFKGAAALAVIIIGFVGLAYYFTTKLTLPLGIPPPLSSTSIKGVDSYLRKLPLGSAVAVAPSEASQYQGFDVSLHLSRKELDKLMEDVKFDMDAEEVAQGLGGVRLSPRMRAELVGEDFIIETKDSKSEQEQAVTLDSETVWHWRVSSKLPGQRVLKFRLHTLIDIKGKETPRTFEVAEIQVSINVNPSEWALRHWEWIASALVLPLIGWGLKRQFGGATP